MKSFVVLTFALLSLVSSVVFADYCDCYLDAEKSPCDRMAGPLRVCNLTDGPLYKTKKDITVDKCKSMCEEWQNNNIRTLRKDHCQAGLQLSFQKTTVFHGGSTGCMSGVGCGGQGSQTFRKTDYYQCPGSQPPATPAPTPTPGNSPSGGSAAECTFWKFSKCNEACPGGRCEKCTTNKKYKCVK